MHRNARTCAKARKMLRPQRIFGNGNKSYQSGALLRCGGPRCAAVRRAEVRPNCLPQRDRQLAPAAASGAHAKQNVTLLDGSDEHAEHDRRVDRAVLDLV